MEDSFFFKQKTAYEMRISDWSSDVCSSDLYAHGPVLETPADRFAAHLVSLMRGGPALETEDDGDGYGLGSRLASREVDILTLVSGGLRNRKIGDRQGPTGGTVKRSEERRGGIECVMK